LFGARGTNSPWDNTNFGQSHSDYIIVEYKIDAGSYTHLISFYSNNISNKQLAEDTNNDGIGDGIALSKTFTEFTKSIPSTGSTLSLRIRAYSNNTYVEEWAIDNFRVLGDNACNLSASITSQTNIACK